MKVTEDATLLPAGSMARRSGRAGRETSQTQTWWSQPAAASRCPRPEKATCSTGPAGPVSEATLIGWPGDETSHSSVVPLPSATASRWPVASKAAPVAPGGRRHGGYALGGPVPEPHLLPSHQGQGRPSGLKAASVTPARLMVPARPLALNRLE